MNSLKKKIIEKIRSEGPINFETFMEMALYYPGLGYYARDAAAIGRKGDFYTGSHLHPVFGAMLGRQLGEMWGALGRPATFDAVEAGAGMGYLAKDLLHYVQGSSLFESLKYTIIELNPALRRRQQELLSEFGGKVGWVSSLHGLEPVMGCFFSNELLDALPVRIIESDGELKEIYVSVREEEFAEVRMAAAEEVRSHFRDLGIALPAGYRTEVNLKIREWVGGVIERLSEGFVLTIDYGYPAWDYYGEQRNRGTFLCYYRHQVNEDPYRNIGEQDMTAHVDFSSLKAWGEEAGLKTSGFCSQGTYLISLGIDEVITELCGEAPDPFEVAKIKGLILPEGMGESHKVMIQYKGKGEPGLRGFAMRNQSGSL
ncbi:MAG: SAM-dependent methyltransferase [Nitrospirae bacterium]|nr:SAM-dependent methyltransferase [Nitrospirota bacterium]